MKQSLKVIPMMMSQIRDKTNSQFISSERNSGVEYATSAF